MKWLLPLTLALPLAGHTLQITGVTLRLDADGTAVSIVAHAPLLHGADPATELPRRLHLELDGLPFLPAQATLQRDPRYDTVTWSARDPRPASQAVLANAIFPDHPEDTTVVLVYRDGVLLEKTALNPAHPQATLGESTWAVVRRFGRLGIAHILGGADHILFLCGLLLVGGSGLRLLGVVTAFTLAHSLTLSLTALGLTSLPPRLVEPVIALSIVVLGLENLLTRRPHFEFRVWLAFGFGFFHGFGFAGALTEAGLPGHAMLWSLGAFNLGVELGQGLILIAALPLLALLHRRSERTARLVTQLASVAITIAGVVWCTARLWT